MNDPHNLQRFVLAQEPVYDQVRFELRRGCKQGHWMWFIFPQIAGLGASPTAKTYAIASLQEAQAYLQHPILGPRLVHDTELVTSIEGRTIGQIFGYPDDSKFRSCMTLFAHATLDNRTFKDALEKFFEGECDPLTLAQLSLAP